MGKFTFGYFTDTVKCCEKEYISQFLTLVLVSVVWLFLGIYQMYVKKIGVFVYQLSLFYLPVKCNNIFDDSY